MVVTFTFHNSNVLWITIDSILGHKTKTSPQTAQF